MRHVIDAGGGVQVHVCADHLSAEYRNALAAVGRAAASYFCDEFVECEADPWAGTYCKLQRGHDGAHSAHYPVSR